MTKGTPNEPELVWEDPFPNLGRGPALDLTDQLAEVRANPGRWARVLVRGSKKAAENAAEKISEGQVIGRLDGDAEMLEVTVAPHRPAGNSKAYFGVYVRAQEGGAAPVQQVPRNPSARPKTAAPSGKLPYVCDQCDADFSTPAGLTHHNQRQHAA